MTNNDSEVLTTIKNINNQQDSNLTEEKNEYSKLLLEIEVYFYFYGIIYQFNSYFCWFFVLLEHLFMNNIFSILEIKSNVNIDFFP